MFDRFDAGEAARRAAEAARRAVEDAIRRAQDEALRATQVATQVAAAPIAGPTAWPGDSFRVATANLPYSMSAAAAPALTSDAALDPPPPPQQTVPVDPRGGARAVVDDWVTTGGAQLGFRDPMVYNAYMESHEHTLLGVARGISGAAPTLDAVVGVGRAASDELTAPAIEVLGERYPDATFRVLGIEPGSVNGMSPASAPTVLIEMTNGGEVQRYAVEAPLQDNRPAVRGALGEDPAVAQAWQQAARASLEQMGMMVFEDPGQTLDYAMSMAGEAAVYEGIERMAPDAQAVFYRNLAERYLVPVGAPDPGSVIVSATVPSGALPASLDTTFNYAGIEGLADSTALPVPQGMSPAAWREALATVAEQRPADMLDVRDALAASGMTPAQIEALAASDPGALPAVFGLAGAGPGLDFNRDVFQLSPGSYAVRYETAIIRGEERTVAVVETSVERLRGDQPVLADTYAVSDVPMTVRIPLPRGREDVGDEEAMRDLLNRQLRSIGTTDVFLHGYQSTRAVWTPGMQSFTNLSEGDAIGIAFAGMGSEGTALGSGLNPCFPRQYGFQMLETLDLLGLYGKEINVVGHSMGGAAAMHMGITLDRIAGSRHPDVRYVLLSPAVGPDSVPFLTEGLSGGLIDWQNSWGSTWPTDPRRVAANVGGFLGSGIVVGGLIPGGPSYVQDVHAGYSGRYGFEQLAATSRGLIGQPYPDPAQVQAFLARNQVLVVAAGQDRIVDPQVIERVFGAGVLSVDGNHYPHLPNASDPGAAGSPALILDAARPVLNAPMIELRPGVGGRRHLVE